MPITELLVYISPSSSGRQSTQPRNLDHVPKQKANMRVTELPAEHGGCQDEESRGDWGPNCLSEAEELVQELENKGFSLEAVSEFVRRNGESRLPVSARGGEGQFIRLCDLSGTAYFGHTYLLRSWQRLYLPRITMMAVLGTLESSRSMTPVPQWVILVGEDRHVYAYGDEELTLVADSLKTLLQLGVDFTGPTYSYPDVSDEDEEILRKDPEIQRIRRRADAFIEESAEDFDDFLEFYDT